VSNNDGELWVEVPSTWLYDDRDDGAKASIWASPDFNSFLTTWSTPGMKLTVFPTEDTHTVADMYNLLAATDFLQSDCSGYSGPLDYNDGRFIGVYGQWSGCGSNGAGYLMLSTVDPSSARLVTMEFQYITQADLDAAARALATFTLT